MTISNLSGIYLDFLHYMRLKSMYYRPVPKFLCVKGILFFSFWQSVAISTLVAAGVITSLGPYTHPENVSVGLNDLLICIEMPFFAIAHNYAFSFHDFINEKHTFVARMPMYRAFRDAFGAKDVIEDSKATLRGEGMDYREFEPVEGLMHQGVGLENRIRAGLRYSGGGRKKYWLPKTVEGSRPSGRAEGMVRGISGDESVHAPLLEHQAGSGVHLAPDMMEEEAETIWDAAENGYELPFGDIDETDEELFDHSKKYLFGDYNYPTIDVSSESARITIWIEEERVLRDEMGAWFSPIRGSKGVEAMKQREGFAWQGYGAVGNSSTKPLVPPSQDGKRSGAFYGGSSEERIIDHEQERITAASGDSKGVVMKWTRVQRNDNGGGSRSRTTSHTRNNEAGARVHTVVAGTNSSGSSPRVGSLPVMSRTSSRSGVMANADAVDLVVEDSESRELGSHERRKVDPSVRGSMLKKVYERDFLADGEVTEGADVSGPEEVTISKVKAKTDGNKFYEDTEWTKNAVPAYRYDDIPDDHNPWA